MSAEYQKCSADLSEEQKHTELKVHLMRRGLSQRQIARDLGITVQYLNDIIRGRRRAPSLRQRLIQDFEIPAQYLEEKTAA